MENIRFGVIRVQECGFYKMSVHMSICMSVCSAVDYSIDFHQICNNMANMDARKTFLKSISFLAKTPKNLIFMFYKRQLEPF